MASVHHLLSQTMIMAAFSNPRCDYHLRSKKLRILSMHPQHAGGGGGAKIFLLLPPNCAALHRRLPGLWPERGGRCDGLYPGVQALATTAQQASVACESSDVSSPDSKRVLVVGATGGVGQLVVAALMSRGYKIRSILRDKSKASSIFGEENMEKMEVYIGDTREMNKLEPSTFEGVTHVICCTGTTAFPSKRWDGNNTPENTDWHGVKNLIDALPRRVQRFVLVSSVGVTKYDRLPWNIMNLFGVLKYKKMGEDYLCKSGIPFTIIRAGRLTDGPYTSYDLNTLLKATAGARRRVVLGQGDKLVGEASRIIVAEACIQALEIACAQGNIYEINSVEGDGPGTDKRSWEKLFSQPWA